MAAGKRYYWLKLKEDFFNEVYVKALRQLPQGDSLVIVYLKMQLKSLKTEGIIDYKGIMPNNIAELALALDESEDVVKRTVDTLIKFGVVEQWENESFYMAAMQALIGSEGASAERVRRHRMLQCNESVTERKRKEKEIDIEKELDIDSAAVAADNARARNETTKNKRREKNQNFQKPTLEEIQAYCNERKSNVDPNRFFDYYEANGWKVGRNPMKDWKAAIRTWERSNNGTSTELPTSERDYLTGALDLNELLGGENVGR